MFLWPIFVFYLDWALLSHLLLVRIGQNSCIWPVLRAARTVNVWHIDGDDRGGGLELADTGEVKENKEKKDFDIETMKDETMKTVFMGLAMLIGVVIM